MGQRAKKNFKPFRNNFLAAIKTEFYLSKGAFEDFFEKNYVFISFPETEQENFRPLTKIIWQRCHNCFPRLQRNILRNVLFPGKTMFF